MERMLPRQLINKQSLDNARARRPYQYNWNFFDENQNQITKHIVPPFLMYAPNISVC